jgi:hypothetical protein
MKKIFLGILVGTLILGTVTVAMAGPLPGEKQDNKLVFIKVLIAVKLPIGNFGILRGNREELRPIGSRPGLMESLPLVKHAA